MATAGTKLAYIQFQSILVLGLVLCCLAGPPFDDARIRLKPWLNEDGSDVLDYVQEARLPNDVIPLHYKIHIRSILNEQPAPFTAPGKVDITVRCDKTTRRIVLHARELEIKHQSVEVRTATGERIENVAYEEDPTNFFYTIVLNENLVPDEVYIVHIEYTAIIRQSPLNGLYQTSYVDPETSERRFAAVTQFQRSAARKAFPCFDEPGLKATFDISLSRNPEYHTLCNMDLKETVPDDEVPGWLVDRYNTSVILPTYLIAIVVSDFHAYVADPEDMGGRLSTVWGTPPAMLNNAGEFGAKTSAASISYFQETYDIYFDMPKLDSVAAPDFSAGAMENHGLVLYREPYLLWTNGTNTEYNRLIVSYIIAHELAHQWFGNLVTNAWWSDIWLNEGFATFMSYWGYHATDPEFSGINYIMTDSYHSALAFDWTSESQPVHNDGINPTVIVYDKGACIIRMMEAFMHPTTFLKAIRSYLKEYSFRAPHQNDLFAVLNQFAVEDGRLEGPLGIQSIMDTWTHQSGYPLIRVKSAGPNLVNISQERFGNSHPVVNRTVLDPNELWFVPISYQTAANPEHDAEAQLPKFWIAKNETAIQVELNTDQWIFINTASTGFYRVLYDSSLQSKLKAQLESDPSVFHAASRSQIIDDYFSFASHPIPYAEITEALDFTTFLDKETELIVWETFFNKMNDIHLKFIGNVDGYSSFSDYYRTKVEGGLQNIGEKQSPGEKGQYVIIRKRLLDWACSFSSQLCFDYANELYFLWTLNPSNTPVPVDIRIPMYCAIVASNGVPAKNFIFARLVEQPESSELLQSLACLTNPNDIESFLNDLKDPWSIGLTHAQARTIINRMARSFEGQSSLIDYIDKQGKSLIDGFGAFGFTEFIKSLSTSVSDVTSVSKIQRVIYENQDALSSTWSDLLNYISTMQENAHWMNTEGEKILSWISNN